MTNRKIKNNSGFVLLFAVMLSSIILAIALGISNIALKEINFTTSARDANNAFYAADTAVECALLNDKSNKFDSTGNGGGHMACLNTSFPLVPDISMGPWEFKMYGSNFSSSASACAIVDVSKVDPGNGIYITTIISKGYSFSAVSGDCVPNSKSVERELQVTY